MLELISAMICAGGILIGILIGTQSIIEIWWSLRQSKKDREFKKRFEEKFLKE